MLLYVAKLILNVQGQNKLGQKLKIKASKAEL